jgi:hypothetical protein
MLGGLGDLMKYARIRDGRYIDVYTAPGDFPDLETLKRCLPGGGFVTVPDDLQNSATDDGDGAYTNPAPADDTPKPNNAGNPYFGKRPLAAKDFFAIAGQVLGARYPRLRNDAAFLWVFDVLNKVEVVDVDDKPGQFLRIVGYLATTNAADGHPLMSAQDFASIMAAWN